MRSSLLCLSHFFFFLCPALCSYSPLSTLCSQNLPPETSCYLSSYLFSILYFAFPHLPLFSSLTFILLLSPLLTFSLPFFSSTFSPLLFYSLIFIPLLSSVLISSSLLLCIFILFSYLLSSFHHLFPFVPLLSSTLLLSSPYLTSIPPFFF